MLAKIKQDQLHSFEWQSDSENCTFLLSTLMGSRDSSVVRCRCCDWNLRSLVWVLAAAEHPSPGSTFCADSYFGKPPPPPHPTHHKWSRSSCQICQRCQWQVTNMASNKPLNQTAQNVHWEGSSFMCPQPRNNQTALSVSHFGGYSKPCYVKLQSLIHNRIGVECSDCWKQRI